MDIRDPIGASADTADARSDGSRGRWEVELGVELSHFSVGEGTNVLVVHGGPGIPQTESAPAFDVLGDAYRFHYYAQRGTGESFRPTLAFSGSRWASIQELEGALGIGQQLADRDSELIRLFEAAGGDVPVAVSPPPSQVGAWHARAQYFSMGRRHDYSDALGGITAPTFVVHGSSDLQPVDVAEDYGRWIADSEIVTIPGAGHFPHYTHGEALAPMVRAFLDRLTERETLTGSR